MYTRPSALPHSTPMIDWSSDDYTCVHGDTFYVPEQTASVYLLDEAGEAADHYGDPHLRVPISRYEYRMGGKDKPCAQPPRNRARTSPPNARDRPGQKEGFYGHVVSDRADGELTRTYNIDWDERPMHYNPNAGTDWAHLVPSRWDRPYYGGPAPSLAYPVLSQSEGINDPRANPWPGTPSPECGMRQVPWPPEHKESFSAAAAQDTPAQQAQMFILVVIIVLLAVALVSANRHARSLEKLLKKSFRAAREARGSGPPPSGPD